MTQEINPFTGGGGGGGVPTGGSAGQVLAKINSVDYNTHWITPSNPTGTPNTFANYNGSGNISYLDSFAYNPSSFDGENFSHTIVPTNAGDYQTLHLHYASVNPVVTDADQNWYMHFYEMSAGDDNSGHQVGDSSNGSMNGLGMSVRSIQTSNVGNINVFGAFTSLGNGTDPMTGRSVIGYNFYPQLQPGGVTIQSMTGYVVGLNAQTGSNITSQFIGYQLNGNLYDVEQFFGTVQGVNFGGTIGGGGLTSYQAAHQFTDASTVQQFTDFCQQASGTIAQNYFGVNMSPNLNDITGGYFGVNLSPTVASCAYADGINVNMDNVTTIGAKRAGYFKGDVQIDGALGFSGSLSIGQLNSFSSYTIVDGGGNPSTNNSLVTGGTATGTVANCDTIGVNTAFILSMDASFQGTSGPFGLGVAALALPNVISMQAGCSLDNLAACVYANSFDAGNTGGTIGRLIGARAVNIPGGGTQTVTRAYSFFADFFAGDIATDSWGLYDSGAKYNWMANALKIGGSSGSTDIVTNSSIGLELESRAIRLANMDTAARNALTAIAGMMIFNTDTSALEYYDGSAWV